MFSIGKNFGAIKRDDMIRNDFDGLRGEVVIVDTKIRVKPIDFVCNEFAWDKALFTEIELDASENYLRTDGVKRVINWAVIEAMQWVTTTI